MSFRFEKLKIWQGARTFSVKIYKITSNFPSAERFGLTSQLRRAAVSVALNIAEGSDRKSDKEFIRFLRISIGSINECITALYIAKDLNYLSKQEFNELYKDANKLTSKINALINTLKRQ